MAELLASAAAAEEQRLRNEIVRLNKVVQALMNRAERSMNAQGSDFGLFQTAIVLEDQVRDRTRELEAALRENEKINRDLQRTKEQMEREIEERKRAHAALEREREEQKVLIVRLEQAMNQLVQAEKLAALGSLVAGVAHELNTPLGNSLTVASALNEVICTFTDRFNAGSLSKQALLDFIAQCREAAQLIERNSQRAAALIGNFKQVAVDQTSMRRRKFDLRQALDEVLSTLQPNLRHTRHRLEVAVEPGIELEGYPGPIEQIIANLLTNSLLHGLEGIDEGTIRVSAEQRGQDQIALCFSDNGIGMNEATARRAFDPFFTTKLGKGGSGLGLYIVYNLATVVLGGTITLASSPGQGARFELLLPRVAPQAPAAEKENHAA
ncbi:sensor histidine kinase [Noviherbaspirillum autotrophicum]|uniref:histidine kinase n=1 Tax=Noviherbaspirillum autotrophicum TaxID=709839 RepID=A0A0C2BFH9_9BURK|nr:ATP-binding protein [Noviherbaspirillum autotrophicum]KIF79985.1 histidine kinase [Noviherbaspirillum autotrophicum]